MTPTLEQFCNAVTQCGLLSADELAAFQTDHQDQDSTSLASALVSANKITSHQSEKLLAGQAEHLRFGDYIVSHKIGEGGMGAVFKAWHRRMERFAAIKVLSERVLDSVDAVQRFYQEVKAAARLNHPNIVTAYDAGERDGTHYLVMEYVDGKNLAELQHAHQPMSIPQAIHYTHQAAQGLAYAHQHGIIHRDVKPSNMIVEQDGQVKILDMGLALLASADTDGNSEDQRLTEFGQVMGTAEFMPPEQAESTRAIDERADVYALGCTLYRFLTGEPIYSGGTMIDVILAHREQPSPSLREYRDDVPESLEAIYQKMVAKNPGDRFQAMDEVVASLKPLTRALDVTAASLNVAAAASVGNSLADAPTIPPTGAAHPVAHSGTVIEPVEAQIVDATIDYKAPSAYAPTPRNMVALIVVLAAFGVSIVAIAFGVAWYRGAFDNSNTNNVGGDNKTPPKRIGPSPTDKPGLVFVYKGHNSVVGVVALSKDGRTMATGGADSTVRLWDVRTGKQIRAMPGHLTGLRALDVSPDGRYAVAAGSSEPIRLWDLRTGKVVRKFEEHGDWVGGLAFSPDGKHFASVGFDRHLCVWETATGNKIRELQAHGSWVRGVAYSPDGTRIATCGNDALGKVWDAKTGRLIATLNGNLQPVNCIAFSRDGALVATGGFDHSIRIWDAATGESRPALSGHTSVVKTIAFTPDGKHLASASHDGTVRVWTIAAGKQLRKFDEHDGPASGLVCSPDGRYVFSTGLDGKIRLWRLPLQGVEGAPDFLK